MGYLDDLLELEGSGGYDSATMDQDDNATDPYGQAGAYGQEDEFAYLDEFKTDYVADRGILGDLTATAKRSGAHLAGLTGGMISEFGHEAGIKGAENIGSSISDWSESALESEGLKQDYSEYHDQDNWVWKNFKKGAESLLPSLAVVPAALAGAAAAPAIGVGAGLAAATAGTAAMYGLFKMGTENQEYEEAIKQGLSEEESRKLASKAGWSEFGSEFVGDAAAYATFGATKALTPFAKQIIKGGGVDKTIGSMLKVGLKPILGRVAVGTAAEMGSEAGNAAYVNQIKQDAGIATGKTNTEAGMEAAWPAMFMGGGMHMASSALGAKEKAKLAKSINTLEGTKRGEDGKQTPMTEGEVAADRLKSAHFVAKQIEKSPDGGKAAADNWLQAAEFYIGKNAELPLNEAYDTQLEEARKQTAAYRSETDTALNQAKELSNTSFEDIELMLDTPKEAPVAEEWASLEAANALLEDHNLAAAEIRNEQKKDFARKQKAQTKAEEQDKYHTASKWMDSALDQGEPIYEYRNVTDPVTGEKKVIQVQVDGKGQELPGKDITLEDPETGKKHTVKGPARPAPFSMEPGIELGPEAPYSFGRDAIDDPNLPGYDPQLPGASPSDGKTRLDPSTGVLEPRVDTQIDTMEVDRGYDDFIDEKDADQAQYGWADLQKKAPADMSKQQQQNVQKEHEAAMAGFKAEREAAAKERGDAEQVRAETDKINTEMDTKVAELEEEKGRELVGIEMSRIVNEYYPELPRESRIRMAATRMKKGQPFDEEMRLEAENVLRTRADNKKAASGAVRKGESAKDSRAEERKENRITRFFNKAEKYDKGGRQLKSYDDFIAARDFDPTLNEISEKIDALVDKLGEGFFADGLSQETIDVIAATELDAIKKDGVQAIVDKQLELNPPQKKESKTKELTSIEKSRLQIEVERLFQIISKPEEVRTKLRVQEKDADGNWTDREATSIDEAAFDSETKSKTKRAPKVNKANRESQEVMGIGFDSENKDPYTEIGNTRMWKEGISQQEAILDQKEVVDSYFEGTTEDPADYELGKHWAEYGETDYSALTEELEQTVIERSLAYEQSSDDSTGGSVAAGVSETGQLEKESVSRKLQEAGANLSLSEQLAIVVKEANEEFDTQKASGWLMERSTEILEKSEQRIAEQEGRSPEDAKAITDIVRGIINDQPELVESTLSEYTRSAQRGLILDASAAMNEVAVDLGKKANETDMQAALVVGNRSQTLLDVAMETSARRKSYEGSEISWKLAGEELEGEQTISGVWIGTNEETGQRFILKKQHRGLWNIVAIVEHTPKIVKGKDVGIMDKSRSKMDGSVLFTGEPGMSAKRVIDKFEKESPYGQLQAGVLEPDGSNRYQPYTGKVPKNTYYRSKVTKDGGRFFLVPTHTNVKGKWKLLSEIAFNNWGNLNEMPGYDKTAKGKDTTLAQAQSMAAKEFTDASKSGKTLSLDKLTQAENIARITGKKAFKPQEKKKYEATTKSDGKTRAEKDAAYKERSGYSKEKERSEMALSTDMPGTKGMIQALKGMLNSGTLTNANSAARLEFLNYFPKHVRKVIYKAIKSADVGNTLKLIQRHSQKLTPKEEQRMEKAFNKDVMRMRVEASKQFVDTFKAAVGGNIESIASAAGKLRSLLGMSNTKADRKKNPAKYAAVDNFVKSALNYARNQKLYELKQWSDNITRENAPLEGWYEELTLLGSRHKKKQKEMLRAEIKEKNENLAKGEKRYTLFDGRTELPTMSDTLGAPTAARNTKLEERAKALVAKTRLAAGKVKQLKIEEKRYRAKILETVSKSNVLGKSGEKGNSLTGLELSKSNEGHKEVFQMLDDMLVEETPDSKDAAWAAKREEARESLKKLEESMTTTGVKTKETEQQAFDRRFDAEFNKPESDRESKSITESLKEAGFVENAKGELIYKEKPEPKATTAADIRTKQREKQEGELVDRMGLTPAESNGWTEGKGRTGVDYISKDGNFKAENVVPKEGEGIFGSTPYYKMYEKNSKGEWIPAGEMMAESFLSVDGTLAKRKLKSQLNRESKRSGVANAFAHSNGEVGSQEFLNSLHSNNASSTLDFIAKNGKKPHHREIAQRLKRILPDDVNIVFVDKLSNGASGRTTVDPETKTTTIEIATGGQNEAVFLHEVVHAAVMTRYAKLQDFSVNRKGRNAKAADKALKDFDTIYNEFLAEVRKDFPGDQINSAPKQLQAAAKDPAEFMTYALTDQGFRTYLHSKTYEGVTLRDKIVEWIKDIFGYRRTPTWLDAAMSMSYDVMEQAEGDAANYQTLANDNIRKQIGRDSVATADAVVTDGEAAYAGSGTPGTVTPQESYDDNKSMLEPENKDQARERPLFAKRTGQDGAPLDRKGRLRPDMIKYKEKEDQDYLYEDYNPTGGKKGKGAYESKRKITREEATEISEKWVDERMDTDIPVDTRGAKQRLKDYLEEVSGDGTIKALGRVYGKASRTRIGEFTRNATRVISDRVREISPKIHGRLMKYENDLRAWKKELFDKAQPFKEAYFNMPLKHQGIFDQALRNNDLRTRDRILDTYPTLKKSFTDIEDIIVELKDRGEKVGHWFGKDGKAYYPRVVSNKRGNLDALKKSMDKEDPEGWSRVADAWREHERLHGELSEQGKADIVMKIINTGQYSTIPKPGAVKNRMIQTVLDSQAKYYENSTDSIGLFINDMVENIAARELIGKQRLNLPSAMRKLEKIAKKIEKSEPGMKREELKSEYEAQAIMVNEANDRIENSVSAMVRDEVGKNVDEYQIKELTDLLKSRITQKGAGNWATLRNIGYMAYLGNPFSAITQIADLSLAAYNVMKTDPRYGASDLAGVFHDAVKASLPAWTGMKTKSLADDVFGFGSSGVTDMSEKQTGTAGALDSLLSKTGIKHMDLFGKEVFMRAAIASAKRRGKKAFIADNLNLYQGDKKRAAAGYDGLSKIETSDEAQLFAFAKLSDFQPTSVSEMPVMKTKGGFANVFYMLKTYNIKAVNTLYRESIGEIVKGNVAKGAGQGAALITMMSLAGAGAEELKGMLKGEDKPFLDSTMDNLLQLLMINKYAITNGLESDTVLDTLVAGTLPSLRYGSDAIADMYAMVSDEKDFKGKSLQYLPFIGKMLYGWTEPSNEAYMKRMREDIYEDIKDNARKGDGTYDNGVRKKVREFNRQMDKYNFDADSKVKKLGRDRLRKVRKEELKKSAS